MTHSQLVHAWNIYLHLAYFLTFNVLIDQNSIHSASGNTFLPKPCDKCREAFGWIFNLTAPVASAEIARLAILRL